MPWAVWWPQFDGKERCLKGTICVVSRRVVEQKDLYIYIILYIIIYVYIYNGTNP